MYERRPISGFPDYEIDTNGTGYTRRGVTHQNWGGWRAMSPGQYWAKKDGQPYLHFVLYRDRKPFQRKVHRLVLETFVGPCPPGMQCRHLNGNPSDNRLENLTWGTPRQNAADVERHGTRRPSRGEEHRDAKLTEESVAALRREYARGVSPVELAGRFGVSPGTASRAARGESWAHVPMPPSKRTPVRRAALSESERLQARVWSDEGLSMREIGRRLGVDPSSISRLLSGEPRRRRSLQ